MGTATRQQRWQGVCFLIYDATSVEIQPQLRPWNCGTGSLARIIALLSMGILDLKTLPTLDPGIECLSMCVLPCLSLCLSACPCVLGSVAMSIGPSNDIRDLGPCSPNRDQPNLKGPTIIMVRYIHKPQSRDMESSFRPRYVPHTIYLHGPFGQATLRGRDLQTLRSAAQGQFPSRP